LPAPSPPRRRHRGSGVQRFVPNKTVALMLYMDAHGAYRVMAPAPRINAKQTGRLRAGLVLRFRGVWACGWAIGTPCASNAHGAQRSQQIFHNGSPSRGGTCAAPRASSRGIKMAVHLSRKAKATMAWRAAGAMASSRAHRGAAPQRRRTCSIFGDVATTVLLRFRFSLLPLRGYLASSAHTHTTRLYTALLCTLSIPHLFHAPAPCALRAHRASLRTGQAWRMTRNGRRGRHARASCSPPFSPWRQNISVNVLSALYAWVGGLRSPLRSAGGALAFAGDRITERFGGGGLVCYLPTPTTPTAR